MAGSYTFEADYPVCGERRPFRRLDALDEQSRVIIECAACGSRLVETPTAEPEA